MRLGNLGARLVSIVLLVTTSILGYGLLQPVRPAVYPDLEFEPFNELGVVQIGSRVAAELSIKNNGDAPIELSGFQTDCTCTHVYQYDNNIPTRVERLFLPAHTSSTVYLDLTISGQPGVPGASRLWFSQSAHPSIVYESHFVFMPVSRLFSIPQRLDFGELVQGGRETRRVELWSDGEMDGGLESLTIQSADGFNAMLTRLPEGERTAESRPGIHRLGTLEVTLDARDRLGDLQESMILSVPEGHSLSIPVSARIVPEFRFAPSSVVLPRVDGSGTSRYEMRVLCRSTRGKDFRMELLEADEPLRIEIEHLQGEDSLTAAVTIRGEQSNGGEFIGSGIKRVRFRVVDCGGERILDLPVTIWRP